LFKQLFGPASFYKEAMTIALPVMMQQFIMSLVSLIDNFMVAGLGDTAMAAVNVSNHLVFIYIVIINTICQAGGIYIAQFKGADDSEGMKHAYRFKVIFGILTGFLTLYLCIAFSQSLIAMMTTGNAAQDDIIVLGSSYLRLVSWTFLPMALSAAIGSSFREIARPKVALTISAVSTIVNTIGNWILIYGNLGAPRLETAGAAYATIIARVFEMACFIGYAAWTKTPFYVEISKLFHIHKQLIKNILVKSGMIFVSELSWISSETIMVAMYNRRGGVEVVAGMAAGWTIANLFFLIFGGIWTAAAIIIGGALGAGRLDEARQKAKWLNSGSFALGLIIILPGAVLSAVLIPIVFSNLSPEARSNCFGLVMVILAYMPLWGLLNMQFAISRAGGDTIMGMVADLSVNSILFVPGAFLLSFYTSIPPVPMFVILKLTDILKCFMCHYFLKKERWVKNLTQPCP
jgi:putative MATE family efflux protein